MCVQDLAIARRTYAKGTRVTASSAGQEFPANPDRVAIVLACDGNVSLFVDTPGPTGWESVAGLWVLVGAPGQDAIGRRDVLLHASQYGSIVGGPFRVRDSNDGGSYVYVTEIIAMPALGAAVKREIDKLESANPN